MQPYDDKSITDDESLIRRISIENHVIYDSNLNVNRISSKAFAFSSRGSLGLSIDIESLTVDGGKNPIEFVTSERFQGALYLKAGKVRKLKMMVGVHKVTDNPYHGEIWLDEPTSSEFRKAKKKLLNISDWYHKIEDVELIKNSN